MASPPRGQDSTWSRLKRWGGGALIAVATANTIFDFTDRLVWLSAWIPAMPDLVITPGRWMVDLAMLALGFVLVGPDLARRARRMVGLGRARAPAPPAPGAQLPQIPQIAAIETAAPAQRAETAPPETAVAVEVQQRPEHALPDGRHYKMHLTDQRTGWMELRVMVTLCLFNQTRDAVRVLSIRADLIEFEQSDGRVYLTFPLARAAAAEPLIDLYLAPRSVPLFVDVASTTGGAFGRIPQTSLWLVLDVERDGQRHEERTWLTNIGAIG